MILATASVIRGHENHIPDGLVLALAAIAWGTVPCLVGGLRELFFGVEYDSIAVSIQSGIVYALVFAWQFGLRGGKQADIENDYMDTSRPPHPRLRDVLRAHYYTGWLTILGLHLYNYSTDRGQKLGWEDQAIRAEGKWNGKTVRIITVNGQPRVHPDDFPFWDCRRPTEALTGLTGDIIIGVILFALVGF